MLAPCESRVHDYVGAAVQSGFTADLRGLNKKRRACLALGQGLGLALPAGRVSAQTLPHERQVLRKLLLAALPLPSWVSMTRFCWFRLGIGLHWKIGF